MVTGETPKARNSSGLFNYLDGTVRPSLVRNGGVGTKRDPDGNDFCTFGLSVEQKAVTVLDARALEDVARPNCHTNGFEMLHAPLKNEDFDFFNHQNLVRDYYDQCAHLVAQSTGAHAYAFDHNIRSASGKEAQKRIAGGQQVQEPLHFVHGDYTLYSAPKRLHDLTRPPSGNDTLCSILQTHESLISPASAQRVLDDGRFAIINVWRNIAKTPIGVHPLALCDAQSVRPKDLVVFEIHYQDRVGENYFAKYSPSQRWLYYPQMTRDEALLIKQWDSSGVLAQSNGALADATDVNTPCTFSFHSAFEDPTSSPDAPDRWSIEVRCMVIFD